MLNITKIAGLCLCLCVAGCTSTKVNYTGEAPSRSICQSSSESLSALVLWETKWRPNQKDVQQRELAFQQGLQLFFTQSGCFSTYELKRVQASQNGQHFNLSELLKQASNIKPKLNRIIVVTVSELGPVVRLLSSAALIEGTTEVVFDIVATNVDTGTLIANFRLHWENGGSMLLKGVESLPQDVNTAMQVAMQGNPLKP
ncbi:MAG TPA: hypothetical protein PKC80_09600 [Burkholderiaceae bacterium]|nr:hypothetical protein [Burkholderiaceae bacterium]